MTVKGTSTWLLVMVALAMLTFTSQAVEVTVNSGTVFYDDFEGVTPSGGDDDPVAERGTSLNRMWTRTFRSLPVVHPGHMMVRITSRLTVPARALALDQRCLRRFQHGCDEQRQSVRAAS